MDAKARTKRSGATVISYEEALSRILSAVHPFAGETVPIAQAAGRFLAQDVRAAIDAPRADVSAMDGYALRMDDAAGGGTLTMIGEAAAGAPFAGHLNAGEAVRIFTGAHLPTGADCVVMQEYAERDGDKVRFREGFGPARHIRTKASDFSAGDVLLEKGQRLDPRAMVSLAGADMATVEVARRPRIALIATGDELADPGNAAQSPHAIPESGSFGVAALAESRGAVISARMTGRDELDSLARFARDALGSADCVVVIGGASVGDHDLARPMFAGTGLEEHFAKVAIKPGKPVWFGMSGEKPVLGLPGNPSSAMVTARLFLAPLIAALQGGRPGAETQFMPHILAADLPANGARETFVRARTTEEGLLPARNQESGAQAPLAASNWLIRRTVDADAARAGSVVRALTF